MRSRKGAAVACATALIATLGGTSANAAPLNPKPAATEVAPRDEDTITLHVIRVRHQKTNQTDRTTRTHFADFVDTFNSYLEASGAPQRIALGEVTRWTRVPRGDACTLNAGRPISEQNGWDSTTHIKVLSYQVGCSKPVAGGQAEIGGTHLTVAGGTTYDTLAHEILHTLGLGHSGSSGCIVDFTHLNRNCPYGTPAGVKYRGVYADVSDLAGGYARGSVNTPDRLQPTDLTGLLNRTHLDTLGVPSTEADTYLDLSTITEVHDISIPARDTGQPGRYLHLTNSGNPLMTISLSSGSGVDTPYRVRPDNRSPAPPPVPTDPQVLAHYSQTVGPLGDTALLNAIPGSRLTIDGPGRFGSGLLPGITYPLTHSTGNQPIDLTVLAISSTEATLRISPTHPHTPTRIRVRSSTTAGGATTNIRWQSRGEPVTGITALWRNEQQVVETRFLSADTGRTSLTINDLPVLDGKGGWRFYLHTSDTHGTLSPPVYLNPRK